MADQGDEGRWEKAAGVKTWMKHYVDVASADHKALQAAHAASGVQNVRAVDNATVRGYVGEAYKPLNAALRKGKPLAGKQAGEHDLQATANKLDRLLKGSSFKQDTIMYRGFGYEATVQNNAPPPNALQELGYTSVSFNPGVSKNFSNGQTIYRVRIPKGFPGLGLARGSKNVDAMLTDEAEVLLPRGTTFKILKRTKAVAYGSHDVVDVIAVHPGA